MAIDAIELDQAKIVRGGHEIIPNMSIRVPNGGILGLVGPSGSGKTTMMRALLGLTPLAAGTATVLGEPAGSASLRPRIGYMPQGDGVYPDLTGRENLDFFAGIYRVGKERVDAILELLDMTGVAGRRVDTYSGGQQQRVGLAIALLHEPPLLILDEPTVGLDPVLRQHLWTLFHQWVSEGRTLVVSTHVMDEAEKCDQVAVLINGKLAGFGTPGALMSDTGASNMDEVALMLSQKEAAYDT